MVRSHWAVLVLVGVTSAVAVRPSAAEDSPPAAEPPPTRPAQAGAGGLGPGGPMGGGGPPGYIAAWYPTRSVEGQPADLGFVRQGLSLGAPLWRDGPDMLLASVGVRNTLFSTDAILPDSLRPFPDQLWNLTFGLNYMRKLDGDWSCGLMGGFGSASDKPFHSFFEVTANVGAFLKVPAHDGRDSWLFAVFYMSGGPVNFPIPLLAYGWNPSERLRVNLGLPLSLFWQPSDDLTVNLSYVPLLNINARLSYRLSPDVQAYGGYEFLNESYFLTDRTDPLDRFFAFDQRVVTGLAWDVCKNGTVELNGGYSFGRFYGEGQSQFGPLSDRVDVAPGPFVGLNARLRF